MMDKIKRYLSEVLGYESYEVDITIEDIEKVDQESLSRILAYVSGESVLDYSYRDYSVAKFVNDKGFNVIASVIAISNLKKDYNYYQTLYNRPIK